MTADVNVVIDHSEYTILVVDDVVSNVLLLKVLLTNEKFKVVTANNGKDALVQAAEKQPDLILLDVMILRNLHFLIKRYYLCCRRLVFSRI